MRPSQTSLVIDIIEPEAALAEALRRSLGQEGYRVRLFASLGSYTDARRAPEATRPAALIAAIASPSELAAAGMLTGELGDDDIPVIMMCPAANLDSQMEALRAGARRCLVKPLDPVRLIDLLDAFTGRRPTAPYQVLLVNSEDAGIATQAAALRAAGCAVRAVPQLRDIIPALRDFSPEVIAVASRLSQACGPELAAALQEQPGLAQTPVLLQSLDPSVMRRLQRLNLGYGAAPVRLASERQLVPAVVALAQRGRCHRDLHRRQQSLVYEQGREREALNQHAIVSVTDAAGNIVYVNDKFCEISGYSRTELLGTNHRVLRSGQHPAVFFRDLWQTIASGQVWQGQICNRRKDGSLYYVESTIAPFLDDAGKPYRYVSIRTDVTRLKMAEAAADANAERLDFLVSTGPVVIYSCAVQPPHALTFVSGNVQTLLGFSATQFCADAGFWVSRIHPDDRMQMSEGMRKLLDHGERSQECRFRGADGAYRWLFDHRKLVRDAAGKPLEILGYCLDIGERKSAEARAEAYRERLRRGQIYANIGTWEWNIATGELFWTERVAPLFGGEASELETSYENFLAAVHPDDRQAVMDAVDACIEVDKPYDIEHRVVWPDGSVRWVLERGAVQRDSGGGARRMVGVVIDIHARKCTELALADRERQLHEAQALAHLGNWNLDLRSEELLWSAEVYRIFGHPPEGFSPSAAAFYAAVVPEDRERVRAVERRAAVEGKFDVVHRIRQPDGRIRHVRQLADVELDSRGEITRMYGTIQDITAQVETQQELMAARDAADRANRAKSEFLSHMSHELRTPLNAVIGFSELLASDQGLAADHRDSVEEVLKAGNHLLSLINELLDLAGIEAGRLSLAPEAVAVAGIGAECAALLAPMAAKRSLTLNVAVEEGLVVHADRKRLRQALLNLLSNAIKYNRDGGSVEIRARAVDADRIRIEVRDDGPGIPAERAEELFEPFNRLDRSQSEVQGTGIGVAITRNIVTLMGGAIGVNSTPGLGSTFWIELPREICSETDRQRFQSPQPKLANPQWQTACAPRHRVLYIEDNPANRALLTQALRQQSGVTLLTAPTGERGVELALTQRPDLILLDINLPDLGGYEVLARLRADPLSVKIPVFAVTANALAADIQRGLEAGFAEYLTKPIDINQLRALLDLYLKFKEQS